MADIFRGPLFGQRDNRPLQLTAHIVGPSLLLTTLAVVASTIPLPLGAAHLGPVQVFHPAHTLSQNQDTSRGTPKTLTADKQAPCFDAPFFGPNEKGRVGLWLNGDTSRGTPKGLIADKQAPCFDA